MVLTWKVVPVRDAPGRRSLAHAFSFRCKLRPCSASEPQGVVLNSQTLPWILCACLRCYASSLADELRDVVCADAHEEVHSPQHDRHSPQHDTANDVPHQSSAVEHAQQRARHTPAPLQNPAHQKNSPPLQHQDASGLDDQQPGHHTEQVQKDSKGLVGGAAGGAAASSASPTLAAMKRSKKPSALHADADKPGSHAEKKSAKAARDKKDKEKERDGPGVDALLEAEVCWKEEKRVPGAGLKGTFVLREPGRYRLSARTLAPSWIPNRAMGYVMTITAASSSTTFSTFSATSAAGASTAPARARRLEFGSPEFVEDDEWFVLQPSDLPCRGTYSIWSHAIFKTSSVSVCIQRLTPELAEEAGNVDWLVPSKNGGMREREHLEKTAPKRIDRELTELLKAIDDKQTVQMVLGVLALCFVSWFNEIASLELARVPFWCVVSVFVCDLCVRARAHACHDVA